jgi:hypothetical protein
MHYVEIHSSIKSNNSTDPKRDKITMILIINSTILCVTEVNNFNNVINN